MKAIEYVFGAVLIFFSLFLVVAVLLQEGNQQNVGAISGGADTFFSKNKARSVDDSLKKWTKFIAIGFFVLVIVINSVMFFATKS